KHMGLMPTQGQDFVAKLQQAAARVEQARLELREAENSRDAFKNQIAALRVGNGEPDLVAESLAGGNAKEPELRASPELEKRIETLKERLDTLQLTYTDRHPDVIAAKRVLEQLDKQKKEEIAKLRKELESKKASAQSAS